MSAAPSSNLQKGQSSGSVAFQRWGGLVGGGALAILGVTRRSKSGIPIAAAGGLLAYLGARARSAPQTRTAESSVLVNCSAQEAYQFWRNFENLARFMRHLESVRAAGDRRSTWVAIGPMGARIRWTAEIVDEHPNESIRWHSLPGSDIDIEGVVQFQKAPGDRGTFVRATMHYRSPAGAAGDVAAKLVGKDPNFLMRQDLRRFKALMEAGEIPTTEGQPHGPRDIATAAVRMLDPDRPLRRQARIAEIFGEKRRVS